jgi:hypothetical protein
MLIDIIPKLQCVIRQLQKDYYINKLGFKNLVIRWWLFNDSKDNIQIHFFWI